MKTAQKTFIAPDTREVIRITLVEGYGIEAELGRDEDGAFYPQRLPDQFFFDDDPELAGMYDFATGEWDMRAVMEFFTDATNADEDTDEFKPVPQMPDDNEPDDLKWLDGYVGYYEAVTGSSSMPQDIRPDCRMCGKPTGKPRGNEGYYCAQCWMEWNS